MENKFYNKKQLSEYLGISIGKIDYLIKRKNIEYYKIGKNVRFSIGDINNWVKNFKSNLM